MAKRNDPERLEAEARELYEQLTQAPEETPQDDQPVEDTSEEQEEVPVDTPDPTDTVETQAEEEPVQDEGGEESELRSALEKAEKAMKGAQARMTRATQEAAELRKNNEQMMQTIAGLKSQVSESQRDTSKLNQIREDYPDLAGPLLDELERTRQEVSSTKEQLSKAEQAKRDEQEAKVAEAHFDRIRAEHPDVDQLIETADWMNWLEESDAQTKQWIQAGSSNDVNTVLYQFKSDMGMKAPTPQERTLEKAKKVAEPKMPKARKSNLKGEKKQWTVDDIVRMPNELFEKHKDEILQAMNTGSIRR
jgi:chromosome segregation ATPase